MKESGLFKGVALFCVALGASFLIAEGALRAYAFFELPLGTDLLGFDPLGVKIEPIGDLGYRQRPNVEFSYFNGTKAASNAEGYRGPLVQIPKPRGTYRIILLGGSTTHGWGVGDRETIDEFMRRELAQRFPDREFEVVNLALDGYDSYQLFERLSADGLRFEPDLVIVNAGVNDVRNARFANLQDRDPRTLVWQNVLDRLRAENARGGPSLWSRIKHYSVIARLPGFVGTKKFQRREMETAQTVTPSDDVIEYFERNLRRIARIAEEHDMALLFSTPPSSLNTMYAPDARPNRAYWMVDAATTQRYRDKLAARMEAVALELKDTQSIRYVSHNLTVDLFIDDAHLTAEGNHRMALDFIEAARPYFEMPDRASASQTDGET